MHPLIRFGVTDGSLYRYQLEGDATMDHNQDEMIALNSEITHFRVRPSSPSASPSTYSRSDDRQATSLFSMFIRTPPWPPLSISIAADHQEDYGDYDHTPTFVFPQTMTSDMTNSSDTAAGSDCRDSPPSDSIGK